MDTEPQNINKLRIDEALNQASLLESDPPEKVEPKPNAKKLPELSEKVVEPKVKQKPIAPPEIVEPGKMASISLDELLDMKFPKQKWLVDGLIPAKAITIISAPPNSYKTWTIMHLALAAATGQPFYGHFETTKSGVLIVDEENDTPLLHQQLTMLDAGRDLPIRIRSMQNFILNEENVNLLWLDCKTYGLKTVMFDSLVDIHRANENDAIEMAQVFRHLQFLKVNGITVILLHHNRKPGANSFSGNNEMRGSSNILAAVDCNITLTLKGDDKLLVKQPKLRYARRQKPFEVQISDQEDSFNFEYLGDIASEPKLSHDERMRPVVIELLEEHSQLSQKRLLEEIKAGGHKTNETSLRKLLIAMMEEEYSPIKSERGTGNTILYSLREEVDDQQS